MSISFVPPTVVPATVVPTTVLPTTQSALVAPAAFESQTLAEERVVIAGDVEWRSTARHLWVGRSEGEHAGMIEHGRNYRLTDADGNVRGSFTSLELAMEAAQHAADLPIVDVAAARLWSRSQTSATVAGVAALALAALALLVR